ncbi:MAG: aminoacyl-tRNA hydrolase [Candidatus Krumholzibacteria bacterium]|nr:aminoacyl-tRNA hydrolase [Candidatus Krumholzibacteria bacterium]
MLEISTVCGLGNPGPRYRNTRHNLGFMALDRVSKRHSLSWRRVSGPAQHALWRVGGRDVALVKPGLFMNESGIALARYGSAGNAALLVVCDDLNLPLGQLRVRPGGGSGGHRGLESIIEQLGTDDFPRLRLGIGGAPPNVDWVEFVLTEFSEAELNEIDCMLAAAVEAIETAVREGLEEAMQRFNRPDGSRGSA